MLRRTTSALHNGYAWAKDHLNHGIGRGHNLLIDKGKGSYLWTEDGKKFLDFGQGIGTNNLGHCHPRLVKVVQTQAEKLWHSPHPFGVHTGLRNLMEQMQRKLPPHLENFMFVSTGAEAVEAALKVSRQATGRQVTVVMQGSFHGRTVATAAMTTSKYVYAKNMRPLMPGVVAVPIPYYSQHHTDNGESVDAIIDRSLGQVHDILHQQCHPSEVSMIIAEPVIGEGGYFPLPTRFLLGLQDICRKNGIVFACDEVQAGYGRTGTFWNHEQHQGVEPDLIVFAKGVANGLPLSGIVTRKELAAKCTPGTMGGTYAGNVLASASACEVIKIFDDEKILENVKIRSQQLRNGLTEMVQRNKFPVMEVRGRGMIGVQLSNECPAGTSQKVVDACTERGLILMNTSIYETLRLIPPLNLTEEEAKEGLQKLEDAMKAVFSQMPNLKGATGFRPCCSTPCQKLDGSVCRSIASF